MNVCSYHLQEAGATPVQELAFALATAIAVLDAVKASGAGRTGRVRRGGRAHLVLRQCRLRFITEICKMRAFAELWDEITAKRYGVTDPKQRLFRYGVQVNSLGLTEQQPENNVYRILIEMLAVTLSKNARARAVQLPAWNEALGLPRPWDQQWSLRMQQILAYETDLLEYGDIFDGSTEIAAQGRGAQARRRARSSRTSSDWAARSRRSSMGYMKEQLVESNTRRVEAIERGEQTVVGVNRFTETEPSPLSGAATTRSSPCRTEVEAEQIERLKAWRAGARQKAVDGGARGAASGRARRTATSCRPRSPAPRPASPPANGATRCARASANTARRPASAARARNDDRGLDDLRADVDRVSQQARPAAEVPGRQARPRRPFQRRRADRGARARRRHGGGLRGHPPHAGRDRRSGARAERACGRPSILSGSHVPLVQGRGRAAEGAPASATCRSWSAASSRRRTRRRCSRPASPRSTRRRISSSTASWPTSCASSIAMRRSALRMLPAAFSR